MPNGANHVLPRSEFHMMGPLVSGTSLRKRPERLFGRHKLDQHVFHKRFHPPYALLHARLLGGHVSNHDQCLLLPLAGRDWTRTSSLRPLYVYDTSSTGPAVRVARRLV